MILHITFKNNALENHNISTNKASKTNLTTNQNCHDTYIRFESITKIFIPKNLAIVNDQ